MKGITTRSLRSIDRFAAVGRATVTGAKRMFGTLGLALFIASGCAQQENPNGQGQEHTSFGSEPTAGYCYDTRIVNGKTEPNYHGAGALVDQGKAFCTGTLVDTTTVVTAAHCLYGSTEPQGLKMYFGPNANDLSSGTLVDVASIHLHPEYNNMTVENDIAVLKLAKPVPVNPIRVLTETMSDAWVG